MVLVWFFFSLSSGVRFSHSTTRGLSSGGSLEGGFVGYNQEFKKGGGGGSSRGQQQRGSVEIVSKETELGLRRRGLARRLMHDREGK